MLFHFLFLDRRSSTVYRGLSAEPRGRCIVHLTDYCLSLNLAAWRFVSSFLACDVTGEARYETDTLRTLWRQSYSYL